MTTQLGFGAALKGMKQGAFHREGRAQEPERDEQRGREEQLPAHRDAHAYRSSYFERMR